MVNHCNDSYINHIGNRGEFMMVDQLISWLLVGCERLVPLNCSWILHNADLVLFDLAMTGDPGYSHRGWLLSHRKNSPQPMKIQPCRCSCTQSQQMWITCCWDVNADCMTTCFFLATLPYQFRLWAIRFSSPGAQSMVDGQVLVCVSSMDAMGNNDNFSSAGKAQWHTNSCAEDMAMEM